jgi:ribosomal protein S18 acetylase RimI-like enzyme
VNQPPVLVSQTDSLRYRDWLGDWETAPEGSLMLIARRNGKTVGWLRAHVDSERKVVQVPSIYVTRAARGQGVGRALWNELEAMHDLSWAFSMTAVSARIDGWREERRQRAVQAGLAKPKPWDHEQLGL